MLPAEVMLEITHHFLDAATAAYIHQDGSPSFDISASDVLFDVRNYLAAFPGMATPLSGLIGVKLDEMAAKRKRDYEEARLHGCFPGGPGYAKMSKEWEGRPWKKEALERDILLYLKTRL